jgi:TonB-dependent starch-binding outer membrane protein SusC
MHFHNLYQARLIAFMKITCIQIALAVCFSAITYAHKSSGQILEKKISVRAQNQMISSVLHEIEQQAQIIFTYNANVVKKDKRITLEATSVPLRDVLDQIFEKKVIYEIRNNQIILRPAKPGTASSNLYSDDLFDRPVRGVVFDQSGMPLPGVNILIKGTTVGTVSDANGEFSIDAQDGAVLVFTFIGFKSQEVIVNDQDNIRVELQADVSQLGEVVVTGYGVTKKSDLTGSVSSVKAEDIVATGVANVGQALQGRAAGVNVISNSGVPGGGVTVRIRGTGSINSGNDPLYVVDGIQLGSGPNAITFLNPSDIASIEVLKDASAAAIYGAQGANGVVLITTKRGVAGTPRVTFEAFFGTKHLRETIKPAKAAEFGTVYLLSRKASGTTLNEINDYYKPYYAQLDGIDLTSNYGDRQRALYNSLQENMPESTDWMNELYTRGQVQNYNVNLSGGSETHRYAASVNYYDESGIVKRTNFDRLSFRYNSDYDINKKLKVGFNLNLVNSQRKGINPLYDASSTGGLNFSSDNSLLSQVYGIDPVTTVERSPQDTEAAGGNPANPFDLFSPSRFTGISNPAAGLARVNLIYKQFQVFGNAFAEYKILPSLVFKSNIGLTLSRGTERNSLPNYFISGQDRQQINSISRLSDENNSWNWINQLTYSKEIKKHQFSVMGAVDALHSKYENIEASAQGLPSNNPDVQFLGLGTSGPAVDDDYFESKLLSFIGRANYSYANKYLVTASVRRDGSSKFTRDYRWGTFASFSVAYRISEEQFFQSLSIPFISDLKLRAGWGQLGNSSVPAYLTHSLYNSSRHISYPFSASAPFPGGGPGNYPYQNLSPGMLPQSIGTPDLTWETQEQLNAGIDLGLFNDQLTISADYYVRTSKDNLLRVTTPLNAGYGEMQPWSNLGEIENRGLEFSANYLGQIRELKFSVGGNIGFNTNEVISIGDKDNRILGYEYRFSGRPIVTEAGRSIGEFIGYRTAGIFQTVEEVQNYRDADGGLMQPNAVPGDFRFEDVNGDGVLNDDDRVVLGSALPKFSYGYQINLQYKNFDLNLFFQGQYGNKILMYEKYFIYRGEGTSNVVDGLLDDAWHGPGTSNTQPRISFNDPNNNFRMSDYYLEDGSFMRLKNVQLGYTVTKELASKLKLSALRFYVSGENLLTFTKYPGLEPELGVKSTQQTGVSSFEYSQPRTYRAGLVAGF